jgi:hypothetical protein
MIATRKNDNTAVPIDQIDPLERGAILPESIFAGLSFPEVPSTVPKVVVAQRELELKKEKLTKENNELTCESTSIINTISVEKSNEMFVNNPISNTKPSSMETKASTMEEKKPKSLANLYANEVFCKG